MLFPTPDTTQRHVALYDSHIPHNIKFSGILKFLEAYKPTQLILGGDMLNLEWASHWNEREFKHIGLEKLQKLLKASIENDH